MQKQEAEAEAAAAAAAAAAPLPADIAVDVAGVEPLANATSEVADFADVGVDAVCSLQLEALAVTRTTRAYHACFASLAVAVGRAHTPARPKRCL